MSPYLFNIRHIGCGIDRDFFRKERNSFAVD